jgi:phenylpropionate dioxygenase-like ring-hydroxylating dioxygenase large terminal subunit
VLHSTSTSWQDKLVSSSNVFSHSVEPTGVAEDRVGAWVPVGSAFSLQGLRPTKIEIMGRNFVGRTDSGDSQWNVALDECPHRFAPLSHGRIDPETKCLECPYHGWQFHSGNRAVATIPQADYDISPTAEWALRLTSYPTHQTGDLIWTFLTADGHREVWPVYMLPEDYCDGTQDYVDRGAPFDVVELPYSYDFLMENGLDSGHHATFSHHKVGFDRKDDTPLPVTVPIFNFTHITIELKYVRKGKERL